MKSRDCLKILLLILIIFSSSCGQRNEKEKSDFYIAKREFGRISNRIDKAKLDSLIRQLPYWKLSDFKTTDFQESIAVEILTTDFQQKGLNTNEFLIYEIKKENDSTIVFYLNHIDSFVYKYNFEQLNSELSKKPDRDLVIKEVPPITGNISGYEGWYKVELVKKKIEIVYAQ